MTKPFVRPDVAAFLEAGRQSGQPPINRLGHEGAREAIRGMRHIFDADATPLAVVRDITIPADGRTIPARLYDRRARRDETVLILFFHGGGFVFGDLDSHEPFCTHLADRIDLPVLAIDYRLAPEFPFPAAPDDCEEAARWAAGSPADLGFAVTALVTCGDSAGGNLAVVTARELAKRPGAVPVIAQLAAYPYFGCGRDYPSFAEFGDDYMLTTEAMDWFDELYRTPSDDGRANCLIGSAAPDLPLLVHAAGLDPLRDQGRAYAAKAQSEGVPVRYVEAEGMIHGFLNMRKAVPSSAGDVDRFIDEAKAMLMDAGAYSKKA
jgi:acetyl esterase